MRAIGGYFELELAADRCFHPEATALNTGRNAFEYILLANGFRKVYIPYYTCNVLLQPLTRHNITYEFYHIDQHFEPDVDFSALHPGDAFLYTNYYGLKDRFIASLRGRVQHLIVDNAQAFFSKPEKWYHAFYSPRKFFGVPDGGYAYTHNRLSEVLPRDISGDRVDHLLIRLESDAEPGYAAFVKNEARLQNSPLMQMSVLTGRLLAGVDYERYASARRANYLHLYNALRIFNEIDVSLPDEAVPMAYPFLQASGGKLRAALIANRIYVPKYWPEILDVCPQDTVESNYAENLIALPIDHRLTLSDLNFIIKTIAHAH